MKLNGCSTRVSFRMLVSLRMVAGPVILFLFFLAVSSIPARAAIDESVPAPDFIVQLELKAAQAKPREQCFLYTELVHSMTQLAGKQFTDGDYEQAGVTLKKIEHYAELIHLNLAADTKRLKDAEMLMQHSTSLMGDYLRHASSDDRPALQTALKQLDHVHDELLNQVFAH